MAAIEQSLPVPVSSKPRYSPSWIDRLNDRVKRLPVPPWVFYLCLWSLLVLLEITSKWLDGVEPYVKLRGIYVFYTFYGVYFLAAIHYLDNWAQTDFNAFRSTLNLGGADEPLLFYQLTTMPSRIVWLISAAALASFTVLFRPLIVPLWEAMGFFHHSTASMLVDLGIFYFNGLSVAVFIYHTLRQLRWISQIHKSVTQINLFQIRPLYALSGLTARTSAVLLLVGFNIGQQAGSHGVLTSDRYALQVSWLFSFLSVALYSLLASAVFFLPFLGLHQLLLREKEHLQAEVDSRLQAHFQELHGRIDAQQLENADAINQHLNSLSVEREILAKLPTWPWQPGTLNLILTAVFLPILLWIIQSLLERLVGF